MDGQDFSRAIVLGGLGGLVELVSLLILFVFPRPGGCCTGISAPPGVTITCSCSAITATSSYTYLGAAIGVVVGLILLGWAIVMARQAKKYPDADIRELR